MEIEIGEYFRTENGKIHKWSKGRTYTGKNKIVKHSKNIIDLIEVGDVGKFFMEYDVDDEDTNIFEIVGKTSDNKELCVITSDYQIDCFPVENLREILTHEQFEQNCYRLEE